jgi:hypothetical protein
MVRCGRFLLSIACCALLPAAALSQPTGDELWDNHFGLQGPVGLETNFRRVDVIKLVGDEIYFGGTFSGVGNVLAPYIAHYDGSTWQPVGSNAPVSISSILIEGPDIYVTSNSFFTANVYRWNGSTWTKLGTPVGGGWNFQLSSLVRYGGQLYAGGWVDAIDGDNRHTPLLVRWNGSQWSANIFNTDSRGSVSCLKTDGTDLFIGGQLIWPPSSTYAILRYTGAQLLSMGNGLTPQVRDIEWFNGQLHAVGDIQSAGIRDIAVWNGTSWAQVGGGIGAQNSAYLVAAAPYNGSLYVAGDFDQVGGSVNSKDLAWWDGTQWHAYTGPDFGANGSLREVAVKDNAIYVAGNFTNVGGNISYGVGKWDGTTWYNISDTPQHGTDAMIRDLVSDGAGGLYASGDFAYAGNAPATHIAHFNGTEWLPLGSGITGPLGGIQALAMAGEDLWAGGQFTTAGGVSANNVARWDGTTWHAAGTGISGSVFALHGDESSVYAGGNFSQAGGNPAKNIAVWNGSAWQPIGSGIIGEVYAIITWNGLVIAGGYFLTPEGWPTSAVTAWDGNTWLPMGSGLNDAVGAFAIYGGDLYATGNIYDSGGTPMRGIAKWDGLTWSSVGGGVTPDGASHVVATAGGLFVCGAFTTAGGAPAAHIARWTGAQWQPLGSGLGGTYFYSLAVVDNYVYAGGYFTRAGNKASVCFARWNDAGLATAVNPTLAGRAGLSNCVPNPFNPSTSIRYRAAHTGPVSLVVYDVAGKRVRILVDRAYTHASEELATSWDGRDDRGSPVASGVYFCRMENLGFNDTRKLVLLK